MKTSKGNTLSIACIGEAMVELSLGSSVEDGAQIGYAGDTLNTAIYLKRCLGDQARVSYVSALGDDPLSDRMIDFMHAESLNTDHVQRLPGKLPGLYAINTDETGERTFSYWRSESAARSLFQGSDDGDGDGKPNFRRLDSFDVLYLSAITLAILPATVRDSLVKRLTMLRDESGKRIVFDSNYRPRLWEDLHTARASVSTAWRACSIALPSVDDEMMLFGDANEVSVLRRMSEYGINAGALKRGEEGPLSLAGEGSEATFVPPDTTIDVVDTTAAGDSFNAGYLAAILSGSDDHEAQAAGHALACKVIGHRGAIIPKTPET